MSTMTTTSTRSSFWLTMVLPALLLALGVGGLFAMFQLRQVPQRERPQDQIPVVETTLVSAHGGSLDLPVDGVVTPYRELDLSAEVAGRVVMKNDACRAGQFVRKGEVLLEIDRRDYELELQRLAEQLKQSEANLAECDVETANTEKVIELSKEEHELQKRELTRMERLGKTVSDTDLDKAKKSEWLSRNNLLALQNQLRVTAARRAGLENAVSLVRTQLKKAELDLERTRVVSPVDGIVVRDIAEQDSFVQKGAPLVVVEDTTKVEIRCNLQMDDLAWLWQQDESRSTPHSQAADVQPRHALPQTPATVVFRFRGSETRYAWHGKLTRFDGSGLDEKTRTVPCRVVVDEPQVFTVEGTKVAGGPQALVRGMYVTVVIHAQPSSTFLRIPEAAVQPGKKVLRVRNGKLDVVGPLQLLHLAGDSAADGKRYWVAHAQDTNLAAADKVIVSPLPSAFAGMNVREQAGP